MNYTDTVLVTESIPQAVSEELPLRYLGEGPFLKKRGIFNDYYDVQYTITNVDSEGGNFAVTYSIAFNDGSFLRICMSKFVWGEVVCETHTRKVHILKETT